MSAEGRHFFSAEPWRGFSGHRKGWMQALPFIKDRTRSMSGWTAEILARPTADWLTH